MAPTTRSASKAKATTTKSQTKKPQTNQNTTMTVATSTHVPVLPACDPPDPIVPACGIPKKVIVAMIAAGAKKEQLKGEKFCILRVDSVDLEAWNLYEDWASSLGEVDPMVDANYAPPLHLQQTLLCPPIALVGAILNEANSIINQFAPLVMADFTAGIPALLATFAPLPAPVAPINIRHAKAAVTVLQRGIRNPGENFPVINGLHRGLYICQVHYVWSNVAVVAPIFRM